MTDPDLAALHHHLTDAGPRLYVGTSGDWMSFADPESAVLVVGPPRSGKTTTLVVPNVLAAPGPVITTSTKPDVLRATAATRGEHGRCWLFDPTGTLTAPPGVSPGRWSPVAACRSWEDALVTARALVGAARGGVERGEARHWSERAEALLAPLLHAAALSGEPMRSVVGWVLRHDLGPARATLLDAGAGLPVDVLAGIDATDGREQSGIWSTASEVLSAYRSELALGAAQDPNLDPALLVGSTDTVYVCAPAHAQALVAPVVAAFIEAVRVATYAVAARRRLDRPVTLVLDEVANVAPLPDLPALVSEGGGQGLLTLACLQDLSQARARWGPAADGFATLFGTKVILGGVGDLSTLELVSRLGGEVDVPLRSTTRGPWWSGSGAGSETWAPHRRRRLPVDAVAQQPPGTALVLAGARAPTRTTLPPWWVVPTFAPPPGRDPARLATADRSAEPVGPDRDGAPGVGRVQQLGQ